MKRPEEAMEILEAYDLTGSLRGAAALAGCDHKTVARLGGGAGGGWRWAAGAGCAAAVGDGRAVRREGGRAGGSFAREGAGG